jgi:hypothetical protein
MQTWQRLGREDTHKIIDSVKSAAEPGLISRSSTDVERAWLPFYKTFYLYRITNYASLPSFTFQYLGDGTFFHYLDGTEHPIHAVNDKGILQLNEIHVLDYLAFYFEHVSDEEDGDIVMIRRPQDMPLLASLEPSAVDAVMRSHLPPHVEYDATRDTYTVETDLYNDGMMLRATITVTARGRVNITGRKMILNAVAFGTESGNLML